VVLDDDIVQISTKALLSYIAFNIIVRHLEFKVKTSSDVFHAGIGTAFGVDFAIEQFAGLDTCHHVAGSAVNADVVAGAELVC
jgi:hypothetical protein